jgi:hypothetical protein
MTLVKPLTAQQRAERRAERVKQLALYEARCEIAAMERRAAAIAELAEIAKVDLREMPRKKYEAFKQRALKVLRQATNLEPGRSRRVTQ